MSVIVESPSGRRSEIAQAALDNFLKGILLISVLFYFLGEKLLFTKGAESSILPRSKSGEIDKTRIHVDEFALVSAYACPALSLS